ncbi:MAG TPA: right-handed parallel beta-helix repeat-containing protein [bacterium]|jgi:hypothetical protein
MCRTVSVLIFVLIACALAHADTTWVSDSLISGTWTSAHSPYMIQRTVTVGTSTTLSVGAGVTVFFDGPYRFNVYGTLRAIGTAASPIYFTTDTVANPSRWRGVRLLQATSTTLQHCVIEYGYATSPGDDRYGGGLEVQNCSPSLSYCTIRYCYALLDGGGVYCRSNGNANFTDCEIIGCYSHLGDGGGLFGLESSPILTRCMVRGNRTRQAGGGVAFESNPVNVVLASCQIDSNVAANGGGLYFRGHRLSATVNNCRMQGNSAARGGGVWDSAAHVDYVNCLISGNQAPSGGGMFSADGSQITMNFCTVANNPASDAAVWSRNDALALADVIVASPDQGTGVHVVNSGSISAVCCDVFSSAGSAFSGAIPSSLGRRSRTNLWGDSCDASLNLMFDPLFVNPDSSNFRLQDSSRCLAASFAAATIPVMDLDNLARPWPQESNPDIGAFENRHSNSSPNQLHAALRGTVGPGTFLVGEDIWVDAADTLTLLPGTQLTFVTRGSFVIRGLLLAMGTEEDSIIITADTIASPNHWQGMEFRNSPYGCRMSYCRISNSNNGNVRIYSTSPTFDHCVFEYGNSAVGGGVYCQADTSHFQQCTFRFNVAPYGGGSGYGGAGAACISSNAVFENCYFNHNRSSAWGGGLLLDQQGAPYVSHCTFVANGGWYGGGAIDADANSAVISNCLFYGNWAEDGGAIRVYSSARFEECVFDSNDALQGSAAYISGAQITRCTFLRNNAGDQAGIFCYGAVTLDNSIISFTRGIALGFDFSAGAVVAHCDFYGSTVANFGSVNGLSDMPPGIGRRNRTNFRGDSSDQYLNVFVNPLFADTVAHDYHLTAASHCIDAGDSTLPSDSDHTRPDIGAFYFPQSGHSPLPFTLIAPANDSILTADSAVTFRWGRASDPDYWDTLSCTLHLSLADTSFSVAAPVDSMSTLNLAPLHLTPPRPVSWWVTAHSLFPDTTITSDTFRFVVDIPDRVEQLHPLPTVFALHAVYPNPFNPATRISYDLPQPCEVRLRVFDVLGREVTTLVSQRQSAGFYSVEWNAQAYPSGMYFTILSAADKQFVRKMLLLK